MLNSQETFCKALEVLLSNNTSKEMSYLWICTKASAYIGSENPVNYTKFPNLVTKSYLSSPTPLRIDSFSFYSSSSISISPTTVFPFNPLIVMMSSGCLAIICLDLSCSNYFYKAAALDTYYF